MTGPGNPNLDAPQNRDDFSIMPNFEIEVQAKAEIEDIEAPEIEVEDLTDGEEFTEKEHSFKITVTDNIDENITPEVKLNGEIITGTDGSYSIELVEGENTITIEATDQAGNKSEKSFVVNYVEGPKADLKRAADMLKVTEEYTKIDLTSPVTENKTMELINHGPEYDYSISISWSSSNEKLIKIEEVYDWHWDEVEGFRGIVSLPEEGEEEVRITATLSKEGYTLEKHFDYVLTKNKLDESEDEKYLNDAIEQLEWFRLNINSDDDTNVNTHMENALASKEFSEIKVSLKSSDKEEYIAKNGDIKFIEDEKYLKETLPYNIQVALTFEFNKGQATKEFDIRTTVGVNRDKFREAIRKNIIGPMSDDLVGKNESLDKIKDDFEVPGMIERTFVYWESSDENILKIEPGSLSIDPSNIKVIRGKQDKEVVLKAKIEFNQDDSVIVEKEYNLTVLGLDNTEEAEETMQELLNENYTVGKLKSSIDGQAIDPSNVKNDIQLLTPGKTGIEGYFNYKFEVESNSDLVDINTYRANIYRPLPGENAKDVELTVHMKHKEKDITVSKIIPIKVTPLTQEEIDNEIELMDKVKENYFQGIKGENQEKEEITGDLKSFREVNLIDGDLLWTRHIKNDRNAGIFPDELHGSENQEQWRLFKSSHPNIIKHENLLFTKPEYTTDVKIESTLSSKVYGKYAVKYPEREDFKKLYKQNVSVTVTAIGDKEREPIPDVEKIQVGVSIVVFDEDGGYRIENEPTNKTIALEEHGGGFTVFGALKATASEYEGRPEFITSINGITGPSTGTGGWMFTVNGEIPNVGASQANLKEGDKVIWYCTYDWEKNKAPTWEELTNHG